MTYGELLDDLARRADDDSDGYRKGARRWLNLVRSHIAKRARWRGAVRIDTFNTSSSTTDGLYTLKRYSKLVEDVMFDETNEQPIEHESHATLNEIDIAKSVTGPPRWWADAGSDDNGNRRLYLWPIPDGTYTVRFAGQGNLTPIAIDDASDEALTVDPFFGPLIDWEDVMSAGLLYHHRDDDNDDAQQVLTQLRIFDRLIDATKKVDRTAPVSSIRLKNVRNRTYAKRTGRFDPAHFENR